MLGDLNGDAWPDLLWQSDGGVLFAWFMTGSTRTGGQLLNPGSVDPAWRVIGLADFDGNGSTDVLFRHVPTGTLYVWWMSGVSESTGGPLTPGVVAANWVVAATEDFNGDHKSDIVWQEVSTGAIYIWYMDRVGDVATRIGAASNQVDPAWRIAGAADMDNDGKPDLLFRHTAGWIFVWYMEGAVRRDGDYITEDPAHPAPVDPTWKIVAVADFGSYYDGAPHAIQDGHADIMFRSIATQTLTIAYFDGVVLRGGETPINALPLPEWEVVGGR